jgi:tryptophan synthase alpha chain
MNRINQLFEKKRNNILSIYFTAGYPDLNSTVAIIENTEKQGVDLIEIGIPFSDPLADGTVIQQSSSKALKNGTTLKKIISNLKDIRKTVNIPLIMMGYFNTVLRYGVESFCKDISTIGIDGVILPDLPIDVYEEEYFEIFDKYNIIPVFLVSPNTPEERIIKTENLSKGFIYAVSTASTTGMQNGFDNKSEAYFKKLKDMKLSIPIMIGFGISNKKTFGQVCKYAAGGIIGSAFVKAVTNNNNIEKDIEIFIKRFT